MHAQKLRHWLGTLATAHTNQLARPLTVAAAVARLPAAVNHVLLAEQQLLAGGAVPSGLNGTHRTEGLQAEAGEGRRRAGGEVRGQRIRLCCLRAGARVCAMSLRMKLHFSSFLELAPHPAAAAGGLVLHRAVRRGAPPNHCTGRLKA